MSPELIAILAVGVAMAGVVLSGQRSLRREIKQLGARIDRMEAGQTELRERMAHLGGLLEGLREAIAHNHAA